MGLGGAKPSRNHLPGLCTAPGCCSAMELGLSPSPAAHLSQPVEQQVWAQPVPYLCGSCRW